MQINLALSPEQFKLLKSALRMAEFQASVERGDTARGQKIEALLDAMDDQILSRDINPQVPDSIEVKYSDPRNGWYVQLLDSDGNQIGEAHYTYRKDDAIAHAKQASPIPADTYIRIYGRDGRLHRTI